MYEKKFRGTYKLNEDVGKPFLSLKIKMCLLTEWLWWNSCHDWFLKSQQSTPREQRCLLGLDHSQVHQGINTEWDKTPFLVSRLSQASEALVQPVVFEWGAGRRLHRKLTPGRRSKHSLGLWNQRMPEQELPCKFLNAMAIVLQRQVSELWCWTHPAFCTEQPNPGSEASAFHPHSLCGF